MLTSSRIRGITLSLLSGLMLIFALPPHDHWWFSWFALLPLIVAVNRMTPTSAVGLGLLTGTVTNFGAFIWCLELMHEYSRLGRAAYPLMVMMCAYQALPFAVWCGVLRTRRFMKLGTISRWLLASSLFVALEYFHPIIFPWYLANSQHSRPELLSVVEVTGVSGLSFLLIAANYGLAELTQRRYLGILGSIALVVTSLGFDRVRSDQIRAQLESAPTLRLGIVQPNLWIDDVSAGHQLHHYQRMTYRMVKSAVGPLDLIIWPESAVMTTPPPLLRGEAGEPDSGASLTDYPLDMTLVEPAQSVPAETLGEEQASRAELRAVQRGHNIPLLFGTTVVDTDPQAQGPFPGRRPAYNGAVLLGSEGQVLGIAKKVYLLIFGETIPFASIFPQVYSLAPKASALLAGEEPTVLQLNSARLGVMVCYEDMLPWFHYELAQKEPQILLNLTNDAWFGRTGEAEAHLALAKLRAVEGRCFLVRSTPSGVSAFIDPLGQEYGRIGQDQEGFLVREVALMDTVTLFERWGNWLAWLCLVGSVLALSRVGHVRAPSRS